MHLSEYVFASKYARYNKEESRRETYEEAIDRMIQMHIDKYSTKKELVSELEKARELLYDKRICGSQRALQFGGDSIRQKNERIYNCSVSYCDRAEFFGQAMFLSLCGVGVGYSVQKHHVEKIGTIKGYDGEVKYVIDDSIEGWSDACTFMVKSALIGGEKPKFCYDKIRKKGEKINNFGVSSGHIPLMNSINKSMEIIESRVGKLLRPIDCFDIVCHLVDCVLAGGIRRSATICIFSSSDEEMMKSKTGNWFKDNPQRARANISVMCTPEMQKKEFLNIFKYTKEYGEPAIIYSKSTEHINNPCVEITMCPMLIKDPRGSVIENYSLELIDPVNRKNYESKGYTFESGFQFCNLTTINADRNRTKESFLEAVKYATLLGTVQATYTDFYYLGHVSEKITRRESLLGVSITGIYSNPKFLINQNNLSEFSNYSKYINGYFSELLFIKKASRITCVKPEGTASLILETSSGLHPYHSKKYLKRVQSNSSEKIFKEFYKKNPQSCEKSVWGGDDLMCINFACEAPIGAMVKSDLDALTHLKHAMIFNRYWVRNGNADPSRLEGADHNVSITVSIGDDEWDSVSRFMWKKRFYFKGVSFLSKSGDYVYEQSPFCEVFMPTDIESDDQFFEKKIKAYKLYRILKEKMEKVFYKEIIETEDNTKVIQTIACGGGACEI